MELVFSILEVLLLMGVVAGLWVMVAAFAYFTYKTLTYEE